MKNLLLTCVCVMSLAFGLSGIAGANSITNGGFETGDFTGWTTSVPGSGVAMVQESTASFNAIDNILPDDYSPTEGDYFAELIAKATLKQSGLSWNAGDTIRGVQAAKKHPTQTKGCRLILWRQRANYELAKKSLNSRVSYK